MNDVINACATYGLQGICLAMMFYLNVKTIGSNTRALVQLEKTLAQQQINQLRDKIKETQCPGSGEKL